MKILFAPDYRQGIPYQEYLARELRLLGQEVEFLTHYRRGLPLFRGTSPVAPDVLHIHWPENYFPNQKRFDALRKLRYRMDLALACRGRRLYLTAHNLLPHNRHDDWGVAANVRWTAQKADGIFVHSEFARDEMVRCFGVAAEKCWLIPYGDHTDGWDAPADTEEARTKLSLPADQKVCLVFGTVSPYKGTDELIEYWVQHQPAARLVVAGPVLYEDCAAKLHQLADSCDRIDLRISDQWLSDEDLHLWLSAVDCSVFNYRDIFTSGAASLARSMGVPLLIPARLKAADLHEPHDFVYRFESLETDFAACLEKALQQAPSLAAAEQWRTDTSWKEVARITLEAYRATE